MYKSTLFCLSIVIFAACSEPDARDSKVVHIAQGPVRGYKDPETGIYFFQGIPYASMPTGRNRFKASLPPPTWMYTLDAINRNIICPQSSFSMIDLTVQRKQEDCLIASVYVPDVEDTNLPVVVFVHGGGFQLGSGDGLNPSKLVAEQKVIVVTFNYRLGIHGFLCLGTKDVPGNAGMKDQVTALRWVQKNIAEFGGNPEDVTIQGGSAGSAAVDLLMLSKSAEGLFSKVIPESGASISQWTIQSDPIENAKRYASYLNFSNVNDIYALEEFYLTASFEQLTSVPFLENTDSTLGPSPCIEQNTGEEVFLDSSPVEILKSGNYKKVPLLYGFSNMEGLMRVDMPAKEAPTFDFWTKKMNEKFSDFLPADLKFESNKQKEEVANQVKKFYFRDEPVSKNNILSYVDFFTDVFFAYSMLRTVKYHVEAGHDQIYLYEYSFVHNSTPYVPFTNVKGASHCAQSRTLLEMVTILDFVDTEIVPDEFFKMASVMRNIWGDFIKTGKPVPVGSSLPPWPPVGKNWSPHMSLGNEIVLKGSLLENRMRFWDDIYSRHYRDPIPPPKPTQKRSEL